MRFLIITMTVLLLPVSMTSAQSSRTYETNILREVFGITEDAHSDYPLDEIHQGCPAVDCIPSIDEPEYIPAGDVDYLRDDDLVLGIHHDGISRAYSARILQRHEIVNDTIGADPVAITYCPLCGSGVAFSRELNGELLDFGVSGMLHGSDLVLYDRQSKSLWQQITGRAFAGLKRGLELESLPLTMTTWKDWREAYPKSQVLAPVGKDSERYKKDFYEAYRDNDMLRFGGKNDPRLHPKKVVYGIEIHGQAMAFDAGLLDTDSVHQAGSRELRLYQDAKGLVTVVDQVSGKTWHPMRLFWFAWYTFHSDTLLFTPE